MPTSSWHAANVGSHRNSANCSVEKEVVLTSCKNVTLLCTCGRDLIHILLKNISLWQTRLKLYPYMNFFKWFSCDCGCYQALWDAWVKRLASHEQLLCITFKWGAMQMDSWRIVQTAFTYASSSYYKLLWVSPVSHTCTYCRLRRNYIRK